MMSHWATSCLHSVPQVGLEDSQPRLGHIHLAHWAEIFEWPLAEGNWKLNDMSGRMRAVAVKSPVAYLHTTQGPRTKRTPSVPEMGTALSSFVRSGMYIDVIGEQNRLFGLGLMCWRRPEQGHKVD